MTDVRVTQGAIEVLHDDVTPAPAPPYTEDSGSVRDTQAVLLALGEFTPDSRITQSSLLLLYVPEVPVRVTQSPFLVLAEFEPDIRSTQSMMLALVDHVACVTKWAQTWTITRTDGVIFAFTSLDQDMIFRGVTHKACDSLSGSATEMSSALGSTGSMEVSGIISSSSIKEEELYNGLFDGATIEVWCVPWENVGGEIPFRLLAGTIGDVEQGLQGFTGEIVTPGATMQQKPLLDIYTPGCRFKLGDDRCAFDLDSLEVSGSVTQLTIPNSPNSANKRVFIDSSRSEDAGFFDFGEVTWVTGDNIGLSSEVKSFENGTFVLWDSLLHPIVLGDTYTAKPGCDLTENTCITKFDNIINFGGFADVPGEDQVLSTPDAK